VACSHPQRISAAHNLTTSNSLQAESLLATVRADYSSWIQARQPLVGSMPLAVPPLPLQSSSEPYLGPSYATFQSVVKSSQQQQQQSTSPSTGSGQIDHSSSSVSASNSNAVPGAPAAAAPPGASGTNTTTVKQQQRSFAAIGFNYNSNNNTSRGGSPSVVAPMAMTMPAALKRPRSPTKLQHCNHHRAFQELAVSSAVQHHDDDSSSVAATTSTTTGTATTASSSASGTLGEVDSAATSASQKKAFWMA
jgi:hypothetical protein